MKLYFRSVYAFTQNCIINQVSKILLQNGDRTQNEWYPIL
ncbi:hypothetical protein LEP1GSC161_0205 [Leptospira santarosai str. CBC1416]|uniref:Uncharacterized protein n=1 Tax=Leptospira santarosai str. CBC1416 TaxID=1193059 RepID=M6VVE7_9LEPT|nr:hypothetical protein LEP1GSC161_0205 [Leptospira santarosai str. CBC1416]